ncbi:MAG: GHKL domain-containing protein [Defluviitaleaceae bacterium]|nr:GHKL domain-containing protein [Defluviitaleaceae bacterium]
MFVTAFLFYNFVIILSVERFMSVFFEEKRTPLAVFVGAYLLRYVLTGLLFLLLNVNPVTLIISFSTLFIIALNYESKMSWRFVATVCGVFYFSVIDFFVFNSPEIFTFMFMGFLAYFVSLLIGKFKNVCVMFFSLHDTAAGAQEEKIKFALQAQEKEYYFSQCRLMQESVEHIKSIRHDMKLHLSTAKDFAEKNQPQAAAEYLNFLLGDIKKSETYSETGNIAVDSIINFKLNSAAIDDLELRLLIPRHVNIEVADIITILGNLLDNALEAASKTAKKKLKLDIEYSRGNFFIQIENSFDGKIKFANENFLTTKIGNNHGYGLKNIRRSLEKYNGHMEISHEKNIFSVTAMLYVNELS